MTCRRSVTFADYKDSFEFIALSRENGILEVTLHSNGAKLQWNAKVHDELGYCFADIANDAENEVVIISGAGEAFCEDVDWAAMGEFNAVTWESVHREGIRLLTNLLDIQVPVIGAVNGPAHVHSEIPLLSNIVLAADTVSFQDAVHFPMGAVPGDGTHSLWPALLGPTRGSYFLLTGEIIGAQEALNLGIVHEVVAPSQLLPRARELALKLLEAPRISRRYTRELMTQSMKRAMLENLSHGLALEGLAMLQSFA